MKTDLSHKQTPTRLTPPGSGHDQLLYFTSPSLTADGRYLVFLSDRTGHPNVFARELQTGDERQLTDNTEGILKSYIYFNGTPYRGLGKASMSLDVQRGIVYYIQGRQICAVTMEGQRRVIAEYPADQMTAYTHISADGTRVCVPTTDARALGGDEILPGYPDFNVDDRVRAENLSSFIRVYDTATGAQIVCEEIPRAWVTHVQFSPTDHNVILYNHEWTVEDRGIRRIWIWDGNGHRCLRTEGDGRSRKDYVTHEMWERDGKGIVYHGAYITPSPEYENLEQFVGRVTPDGATITEIALPRPWGRYGHFTVGHPGQLVTDGYYEEADDQPAEKKSATWINGGTWITYMKVDWPNQSIEWVPLTRSGSSWNSQDCHPHPIFSHESDGILFTSDREGNRAVYRVEVPK